MSLTKPNIVHIGRDGEVSYSVPGDAVTDLDNDPISWIAKLSDGGDLPIGLTFSSVSRSFSGLPVAGIYNISIIASDGHGDTVNQTISLRVNSQPAAKLSSNTVSLPGIYQPFSWAVPIGMMTDADGDVVTYSLVRTNPEYIVPAWLSFNGTAIRGTPTANSHRPIPLLFEGKDPYGGVGQVSISLLIDNTFPKVQIALAQPGTIQLGEGAAVDYAIQSDAVVDADGDIISWSAKLANGDELPSGLVFDSASRRLSGLPTAGVYLIRLIASDAHGGTVNQTISLRVNSQPVASLVDTDLELHGVHQSFIWILPDTAVVDGDNDTLTHELVVNDPRYLVPTWLSFNGTTLRGVPTTNTHNAIQLLLKSKDPHGGVGHMPISLSIKNLAPVAQIVLSDPAVIQVGEEFSYTFPSDTFIDPEGDSLQYSALLSVGDGSLPAFLSFNPITRVLSGISTVVSAGYYEILFQADDSYGGITNSSAILIHVNTPPTALSTPWFVNALPVGQTLIAELPMSFMDDADGDSLSYSLVRTNPEYLIPTWLRFVDGALTGAPPRNDHQPVMVQFKGEDGFGGEAYRLVSISIPNSSPIVNRVLGVVSAFAGELKTHIVPRDTIVDIDGDELAYTAFQEGERSLPEWAIYMSGLNSFNFVPKSGDQGNYTFVLVASDTQGVSVQTELGVYIPNRPPVLTTEYADQNLGIFNSLNYAIHGHFSDADGDTLTYEVIKPQWVSYSEGTKTLSGDPPKLLHQYTVDIQALDGRGGSAQARLHINVDPTEVRLSSVQLLQIGLTGAMGVSLFILASIFMVQRHRKIKQAERGAQTVMRKWLSSQRANLLTEVEEDSCKSQLQQSLSRLVTQFKTMGRSTDKDELETNFDAVKAAIQRYYAQTRSTKQDTITTLLIGNRFIDEILYRMRMAIMDEWPAALQRTLAGILHDSMQLIWVCHTGRSRQLDEMYKTKFLTKLHDLCNEVGPSIFVRLNTITKDQVETYHRLLSAREAMLSVQGKSTWVDVVANIFMKLLSPVGMFQLLKDFWRNAPQGWYFKLVMIEQSIGTLDQHAQWEKLKAQISEIQKQAMRETHWAFRYGLVVLWRRLLEAVSTDGTLSVQVTQGSRKLLGKVHLEAKSIGCCNGKRDWVSRHAQTIFAARYQEAVHGAAAALSRRIGMSRVIDLSVTGGTLYDNPLRSASRMTLALADERAKSTRATEVTVPRRVGRREL